LQLSVSLDGKIFADAHFPTTLDLHKEAYTIMESKYNVWLHVSTNTHKNGEFGHIFTSNSNGTYYVLSLQNANRNEFGIVDFEKMQGIDGIAVANMVTNPNQANIGDSKKLLSMITFNAGADWNPVNPPPQDVNGKKYDCSVSYIYLFMNELMSMSLTCLL
jgi:Sortilin, neurotensin receptor 3,